MIPTPSPVMFLAVIVIYLLVAIGFVVITAAVNELTARLLGNDVGCLVGGIAAGGWVWLLTLVENGSLAWYAVVLLGIPLATHVGIRVVRARGFTRPP